MISIIALVLLLKEKLTVEKKNEYGYYFLYAILCLRAIKQISSNYEQFLIVVIESYIYIKVKDEEIILYFILAPIFNIINSGIANFIRRLMILITSLVFMQKDKKQRI